MGPELGPITPRHHGKPASTRYQKTRPANTIENLAKSAKLDSGPKFLPEVASAIGVYRLGRDSGYAAGAVLAGVVTDLVGVNAAIEVVTGITSTSGTVVAVRFREATE